MRMLPISDVHVEFHPDDGAEFLDSLPTDDVDVLVVAGDLGDSGTFEGVLEQLAELFPLVVYVHGNHECYGSSVSRTRAAAQDAASRHRNVHFLDNDVIELDGKRFVGTTMWFRPNALNPVHGERMNDWAAIDDFARVAPLENAKALRFLDAEVRPRDVVVTHHAPLWRSADPRWKKSPLSRLFYVCDMNDLIHDRQPAVWIHGHVHHSWDYSLWGTRVVCNPAGYLDTDPNREFAADKIIEI